MLLPTHLIKFQLDHDEHRRASEVKEQQTFEKSRNPAAGAFNRAGVSGTASVAAKPANQYEESTAPGHEHASFSGVEELRTCVSTTNTEGQEGDELDRIVAEVQEIADLVFLDSKAAA